MIQKNKRTMSRNSWILKWHFSHNT